MQPRPHNLPTIQAALEGDLRAWESVVQEWIPAVVQWARRLGGPSIDPHDVAQEVFETLWRRLDTRRVVAGHRRRAWLRRWVPGLDPADVPGHRVAPPDAERGELARRVWQVLDRLPPPQREVLVLCDMEERTSAEVATLLDIPHPTVRSRLRLARERFRQEAGEILVFPGLLDPGGEA